MTVKEICLEVITKNYQETYKKKPDSRAIDIIDNIASIASSMYFTGYKKALSECSGGGYSRCRIIWKGT